MKKLLMVLCLLAGIAQADKMDELLEKIRQGGTAEKQLEGERLERFVADRNERKRMLEAALAELAREEARSRRLSATVDENERQLKALEETLHQRSGALGEFFGVVRQNAGEFKAVTADSVISAQLPGRTEWLGRLAASRELPEAADLEKLWYLMAEEMAQSGRVVRFETEVIGEDGTAKKQEVVRLGAFGAIAQGRYLHYDSALGLLTTPVAQPAGGVRAKAEEFEKAAHPSAVAIDPTRGAVLSLLSLRPGFMERMAQGGSIGYLILLLGIGGVAFGLWQALRLHGVDRAMKTQLDNLHEPKENNPLGRVQRVWLENRATPPEALSAAMDEAVLKELPELEKGQGALKLLAAVAPLLGLLGTVVGMIATFQSITLFGTGDPKLMAGGISQALVTTMQGLIVAVPLLFLHGWLRFRSGRMIDLIESQSAGLMAETLEARRG
ncbi:MAG: MotA/TolQ/ExbB proton channel family protein [Campylobacterales bacterium]